MAPTKAPSWIVPIHISAQSRFRILCFPHAGGGTASFNSWVRQSSPDIDLYGVRLPGRESRMAEVPATDLQEVVEALSAAVEDLIEPPFAFFGSCSGSLIAYGLAHHFHVARRPEPACLFVSSCVAPCAHIPGPPIHELPRQEFLETLRKIGGTPEEILNHDEFMTMLEPALRADFQLAHEFMRSSPARLSIPISAFGGLADHRIGLNDLVSWRQHSSELFMFRLLPGGHFLLDIPHSPLLQVVHSDLELLSAQTFWR